MSFYCYITPPKALKQQMCLSSKSTLGHQIFRKINFKVNDNYVNWNCLIRNCGCSKILEEYNLKKRKKGKHLLPSWDKFLALNKTHKASAE